MSLRAAVEPPALADISELRLFITESETYSLAWKAVHAIGKFGYRWSGAQFAGGSPCQSY